MLWTILILKKTRIEEVLLTQKTHIRNLTKRIPWQMKRKHKLKSRIGQSQTEDENHSRTSGTKRLSCRISDQEGWNIERAKWKKIPSKQLLLKQSLRTRTSIIHKWRSLTLVILNQLILEVNSDPLSWIFVTLEVWTTYAPLSNTLSIIRRSQRHTRIDYWTYLTQR